MMYYIYRVTDVSTQIRSLYPKLFVSPTKKIANIIASQYVDTVRTQQSTLTTIWVGINDIGLTHDWNDTNALDIEIMQKYQVLIVKYTLTPKKHTHTMT